MNVDDPTTIPEPEDELDDPYVHTVSTEEFVETVERASHEEAADGMDPNEGLLPKIEVEDSVFTSERQRLKAD